ncbi:MAG TPA: type II secretion system protein [Chthonomonadaceae bacterium]|nr:type II secretion system protein [Chthonomonadaceae bacterium]
MTGKSARAFTLIELLTVIAIIAVVTALLFPVMQRARMQSQKDVCLSNLHQLGSAIALYAADYDGKIPYAADVFDKASDIENGGDGSSLDQLLKIIPDIRTALQPYKASQPLFHCPLDRFILSQSESQPDGKMSWFDKYGSSYAYDQKHALAGRDLAQYPSSAQNLLMWDYESFHVPNIGPDGMLGALFADMHVKTITWQQRTEALKADP